MHSPFVFQFILHVLNNRSGYQAPAAIEALRKKLLKDERVLTVDDFGAGSRLAATRERSVQQLAASAAKPKKYAQLLFRLVKHYQPKTILELGTSLGITTAYLATANPEATVTTVEGSEAIAAVAKENFKALKLQNVQPLIGNFNDVLPSLLQPPSPDVPLPPSSLDLAYVDGNHRYAPTLNYFHQLLPKTHNDSVLIFDDIHWSAEMEKAWEEIKQHSSVRCTVDVFFLGFVFFRQEFKAAQHFTVRF